MKASVFAGRGTFSTVPGTELHYARTVQGQYDWIAVLPSCDRFTVEQVRALGFDVHTWEPDWSNRGARAVRASKTTGYIGQAEGPLELKRKKRLGWTLAFWRIEKALISNITFLPPDPKAWPRAWGCIPEAYANVNPNATPEVMAWEASRRGARVVSVCFGMYDGATEQPGGWRPDVDWYLERYPYLDWCTYAVEYL